jgi:putative transposase
MDWFSRRVLELADLQQHDGGLLRRGARGGDPPSYGAPEIFNTDQGSQFTAVELHRCAAEASKSSISMDGRGAWRDNVFVERLWKSVKYEEVYLHAYDSVAAAKAGIGTLFCLLQRPASAHGP